MLQEWVLSGNTKSISAIASWQRATKVTAWGYSGVRVTRHRFPRRRLVAAFACGPSSVNPSLRSPYSIPSLILNKMTGR